MKLRDLNKILPFTSIQYQLDKKYIIYGHLDWWFFMKNEHWKTYISWTITDICILEPEWWITYKCILNWFNFVSWSNFINDKVLLEKLKSLINVCRTWVNRVFFDIKKIQKIFYPHQQLKDILRYNSHVSDNMKNKIKYIVAILIERWVPYNKIWIYWWLSRSLIKIKHKDFDILIDGIIYSNTIRSITKDFSYKSSMSSKFTKNVHNTAKYFRDKIGKINLWNDRYCDIKVVVNYDENAHTNCVLWQNYIVGERILIYWEIIDDKEWLSCPWSYIILTLDQTFKRYRIINTIYEFCGSTYLWLKSLVYGFELLCDDWVPTVIVCQSDDFIISIDL